MPGRERPFVGAEPTQRTTSCRNIPGNPPLTNGWPDHAHPAYSHHAVRSIAALGVRGRRPALAELPRRATALADAGSRALAGGTLSDPRATMLPAPSGRGIDQRGQHNQREDPGCAGSGQSPGRQSARRSCPYPTPRSAERIANLRRRPCHPRVNRCGLFASRAAPWRALPRRPWDENRQETCETTGGPDTIRTCDLCLRRAALYPAELRVRSRGRVITAGCLRAQAA
jgi:hypothetical protein